MPASDSLGSMEGLTSIQAGLPRGHKPVVIKFPVNIIRLPRLCLRWENVI